MLPALREDSPPASAVEATSPRTRRQELARVMGVSLPRKGTNEASTTKPCDNTGSQKRRSSESVRRSATLRQPRKMN